MKTPSHIPENRPTLTYHSRLWYSSDDDPSGMWTPAPTRKTCLQRLWEGVKVTAWALLVAFLGWFFILCAWALWGN